MISLLGALLLATMVYDAWEYAVLDHKTMELV